MRVAIVAEFYPRAADPVLGLWAHRQAIAARDAGADVRVLVLYRPLPSLAAARRRRGDRRPGHRRARSPSRRTRRSTASRSPTSRSWRRRGRQTYGSWGRWAAPPLAVALRALRRRFAFDLVHAHNAVPAGEAVRRAGLRAPLVVSVHGGDVFHTAPGSAAGAEAVRAALAHARLVIANSAGIEQRCRALGARDDARRAAGQRPAGRRARPPTPRRPSSRPATSSRASATPTCCARSRCWPTAIRRCATSSSATARSCRRLRALAGELGVADRARARRPARRAARRSRARAARRCSRCPRPTRRSASPTSRRWPGWLPAIGAQGEPGPREIVQAGGGGDGTGPA